MESCSSKTKARQKKGGESFQETEEEISQEKKMRSYIDNTGDSDGDRWRDWSSSQSLD